MKTITTIVLAILCLSVRTYAQPCSVSNTSITITNVNTVTKEITFDLTFAADMNSGAKHAAVHLWEDPAGGYPVAITYPATATATSQAKGTLVIKDPGSSNPLYEPSYPSSMGTLSSPYLVPSKMIWSGQNSDRTFTFKDLKVTLSTTSSMVYLKGDVYTTQNDNNTTGGCLTRGGILLAANNPLMNGYMVCGSERSVYVSLSTLQVSTVTLRAFKDVAPFGIFDDLDRAAANELTMSDAQGVTLTKTVNTIAQPVTSFTQYGPYTFSGQAPGSRFSVWMTASLNGVDYNNIYLINNPCNPLPVSLTSFTAVRNGQQVQLKWTTAREENNSGFAVERKSDGSVWRQVAFVESQVAGGTSDQVQNYAFTDQNPGRGLLQYRLRQTDINGSVSYSEIKTLRADGQSGQDVLVFPNPVKGPFTVLLPGNTSCDIQLCDGSGRIVKQYTGVSGSRTMEAVQPGLYFVKIIDPSAGTTVTKKILVQ